MFLRSFALINSADHLDARPSGRPSKQRTAPLVPPVFSDHPSNWSQSAVAAELVSLTRLFKRLMRSRSRTAPVSRVSRTRQIDQINQVDQASPIAPATPMQWQPTVAAVRQVRPSDANPLPSSCRLPIHGSDRVPAMLRKAQAARRLSPVRVGDFLAAGRAAVIAHPRVHADPVDPQRVVISGSFAEVCATLDRLIDSQETTTR